MSSSSNSKVSSPELSKTSPGKCPIPLQAAKEFTNFVERLGPGNPSGLWTKFVNEVGGEVAHRENWIQRVKSYGFKKFLQDFCEELVLDQDYLNHERNEYEQSKKNVGKRIPRDWMSLSGASQGGRGRGTAKASRGGSSSGGNRNTLSRKDDPPLPSLVRATPQGPDLSKTKLPPEALGAIANSIKQQAMMERSGSPRIVNVASFGQSSHQPSFTQPPSFQQPPQQPGPHSRASSTSGSVRRVIPLNVNAPSFQNSPQIESLSLQDVSQDVHLERQLPIMESLLNISERHDAMLRDLKERLDLITVKQDKILEMISGGGNQYQ